MNEMLKNKVRKFLEYSEMNKTIFCKRTDISATTLNSWLRGERDISVRAENRIAEFMALYVSRLVELAR